VREHDLQVLRTNTALQTTEAIPEVDGSIRHWLVCKFPLSARAGDRLLGGIAFDVTEQRNLERQLLRAQRMESLGILAGGIAHDLNNVLLPVSLGVEVLRETAAGPLEKDVLNVMQVSTTRASGLIRQVLTFARGAADQKLAINPAHVLRDVVAIARRTFSPAISISTDIARNLSTIEADPTQLHQVLLNLVVNAHDAMPAGGKLSVRARNVPRGEVRDHFGGKPDAQDYILVEVSDTGTGIPEALRDRIFEPFFTTKEIGKGTGLGLSTSLGIIKSHSGFIDFVSSPAGTTFNLYLPASREEAAMESRPTQPKDLTGGAEVVLIIDDEVGAREIAKAVLGRNAYQVLTAPNGVEGLATFRRFIDRIHAVLIDHRMPLMDGPDAVREIRQASPTVKIIGMSGHAPTAGAEFISAGADAFLPKPFTAEQVLSLLQSFLHPPG
jgi:signal transduction histidine kinase